MGNLEWGIDWMRCDELGDEGVAEVERFEPMRIENSVLFFPLDRER